MIRNIPEPEAQHRTKRIFGKQRSMQIGCNNIFIDKTFLSGMLAIAEAKLYDPKRRITTNLGTSSMVYKIDNYCRKQRAVKKHIPNNPLLFPFCINIKNSPPKSFIGCSCNNATCSGFRTDVVSDAYADTLRILGNFYIHCSMCSAILSDGGNQQSYFILNPSEKTR